MDQFSNLSTEKFRMRMRPAALRIYQRIWPGVVINDLRGEGVNVHILDKEFGIDTLATLPSKQWISIQEKYRQNWALKYLDFTQEFMNAEGCEHESPGEWFRLGSQLYFLGWANVDESDFEKWALLDVVKYKLIVEQSGGLHKIGVKQHNNKHGRASFYAIPIRKLESAFVYDYRMYARAAA